jgi:hypothetical protein
MPHSFPNTRHTTLRERLSLLAVSKANLHWLVQVMQAQCWLSIHSHGSSKMEPLRLMRVSIAQITHIQ